MSSLLEASRKELTEAYKLALWRYDFEEAAFWRAELIDRTVALVNKITED